ncbi:MAG: cytochrome P450 [Bdellovibrionota bacterium]
MILSNRTEAQAPGQSGRTRSLPTVSRLEILTGLTREKRDYLAVLKSLRGKYGDRFLLPSPFRRHCMFHPDDVAGMLGSVQHDFGRTKNYDPMKEILGEGLLTSEGETWRHQRQNVGPELSLARARDFASLSAKHAEEKIESWDGAVDVFDEIHLLTLRTAGESFFGSRVEQDAEAIRTSLHAATKVAMGQMMCPAFAAKRVSSYTQATIAAHAKKIESVFERILASRSDSNGSNDLFARLLKSPRANPKSVRDQAVTFLLAGHETTSIALSWHLALLARHPDIQTLVREAGPDSSIARAALKETLRLFPSVPVVTRLVKSDFSFDGIAIAADEQILFSSWVTHRHPDFWPKPDEFDPERFSRETPREGTYFPFGLGPRECVGKHFATEQMLAITSVILERYDLSIDPAVRFDVRPQATLQPAIRFRISTSKRA